MHHARRAIGAVHGRLAVDFLNPEHLNALLFKIKKRASELGCDLLVEYHTDLFQVEATLLFDVRDAHVHVLDKFYHNPQNSIKMVTDSVNKNDKLC